MLEIYILLKYLHVLSIVFWYHSWASCHVFLQEKSVLVFTNGSVLNGKAETPYTPTRDEIDLIGTRVYTPISPISCFHGGIWFHVKR